MYDPIIQALDSGTPDRLDMLRLDLIDPEISGNKWFKLKYNLEKAVSQNKKTIITYGGAFSNHIAATAAACKKYNLKCIGVIRGEENAELNDTLRKAKADGMILHFVDREIYKHKNEVPFKDNLKKLYGEYYLIPEGGNNIEGVEGCFEILKKEWDYDRIFCACGTAATFSGLLVSKKSDQVIIGISVLKGENKLPQDVNKLIQIYFPDKNLRVKGVEALEEEFIREDCIINSYAFNGYAKMDRSLVDFKNGFESRYKIPLDHIYTAKLVYGVFDLIKLKKLKPGSKSLIIHSGGLQGNKAFEQRYHLTPSL